MSKQFWECLSKEQRRSFLSVHKDCLAAGYEGLCKGCVDLLHFAIDALEEEQHSTSQRNLPVTLLRLKVELTMCLIDMLRCRVKVTCLHRMGLLFQDPHQRILVVKHRSMRITKRECLNFCK